MQVGPVQMYHLYRGKSAPVAGIHFRLKSFVDKSVDLLSLTAMATEGAGIKACSRLSLYSLEVQSVKKHYSGINVIFMITVF